MRVIDVAIVVVAILLLSMMVGFPIYIDNRMSVESAGLGPSVAVPSTASVGKVADIQESPMLGGGINFGTVQTGSSNNNAEENDGGISGETLYFIESTSFSNFDIELCISYDDPLTDTNDNLNKFLNGDESFDYDITASGPANAQEVAIPDDADGNIATPTQGIQASGIMAPFSHTYYRFWLDVQASQAAANYENDIFFVAAPDDGNGIPGDNCNV